jgi:hypothetical protein
MLISLHEHFKIRITDWLVSAILLSWGFALFAVRPEVWALPTFSGLRMWNTSQQFWATLTTCVALIRIGSLFVNGAVRRSPHLRGFGAFLSVFVWFQLSLGIMFGDMVGPAVAIFPWLMLADIFNVYRAAGDARGADERAARTRKSVAARGAGSA